MLRNKYILFIFLFLAEVQVFASQVDSVQCATSGLEMQNAETILAEGDSLAERAVLSIENLEDSVVLEVLDSVAVDTIELADAEFEAWLDEYATVVENDSVEVKSEDFVSLIDEGEEAKKREKNELIFNVMKSFKKKSGELAVRSEEVEIISDELKIDSIEDTELRFNLGVLDSLRVERVAVDSLLDGIEVDESVVGVNPLFMDWVLGVDGVVSRQFDNGDSLLVILRRGAKEYVRGVSPELYAYHWSELPSMSELQISRIGHNDKERLLLVVDSLRGRSSHLRVDLPEFSRWSKGAKFQVHASQNYISSNWYKGGESNMAMTMYAMGYFNYDNRRGLQWDNKAEWKLGLYGMASDSLRWLRVNEDLLRLNSKLGYKAFKNFYYTAEWDFQTQLFNTFKSNTYVRSSGPFSPVRMSLSAGMDYKYKMVSVFLSPLSYKLVYVADMSVRDGVLEEENIAHQVGITDGTRVSNQLGALIRTDFDYDFSESIGMEVHFSFFGNYVGKIKGIEIGCEVIGNFKINRFLSAKVSLYPRYDSTTIPADGGKPKMQFYELISLGFNYRL